MVDVGLYDASMYLLEHKAVRPRDTFEIRFSIAFCVAATIVYGTVGLTVFTNKRIRDERIVQLMAKVSLHRAKELNENHVCQWPAIGKKAIVDSHCYEEMADYPRGVRKPSVLGQIHHNVLRHGWGIILSKKIDVLIKNVLNIKNLRAKGR